MSILKTTLSEIGIDAGTQRLLSGSSQTAQTFVTTEVEGLAELDLALTQFPDKLAKKTIVAAVRAGSKLFQERAQNLAPEDPTVPLGHPEWRTMRLREGIRVIVSTKNLGAAGAMIRGEIALDKKHAFFGRFVEFGHISASGSQVAPRPYMRPAFESSKEEVLALFEAQLALGVAEAAAELFR